MSFPVSDVVTNFKSRMIAHSKTIGDELDGWVPRVTSKPIDEFVAIVDEIQGKTGKAVDWDRLPPDEAKIVTLWAYREAITCLLFVATNAIINGGSEKIKIADFPERNFHREADAKLVILGSTTLLSDIDINVVSTQASVWIAIAEDLWAAAKFNHTKWKVDLYGDFTKVGEYYLDSRYLSKTVLLTMLHLAVASFLRHPKSEKFNQRVLTYLVQWCIESQGLLTDVPSVLAQAALILRGVATSTRETYYNKLGLSEAYSIMLSEIYGSMTLNKEEANELIGHLITTLGTANLYREENYILTTTVIHIVRVEQAAELEKDECPAIKTVMAKCSLSPYVYILSAIEQLGYMQSKISEGGRVCTLPASKYFGRLVRAIREAAIGTNSIKGILKFNPNFTALIAKADQLAALKKQRGNHGDTDMSCGQNYNLYRNILKLFSLPTRSAGTGRPISAARV